MSPPIILQHTESLLHGSFGSNRFLQQYDRIMEGALYLVPMASQFRKFSHIKSFFKESLIIQFNSIIQYAFVSSAQVHICTNHVHMEIRF